MDENNRISNNTKVQENDTILEFSKSSGDEIAGFKVTKVLKCKCVGISLVDGTTKTFKDVVSFDMSHPRDFSVASEVFHRVYR